MSLAKWVPAHFSPTSQFFFFVKRKTLLRFGKRYAPAAGQVLNQQNKTLGICRGFCFVGLAFSAHQSSWFSSFDNEDV